MQRCSQCILQPQPTRQSGCRGRTVERESFDFAVPFYMLLWSHHQAAVRSTFWKARGVIITRDFQKK